MSYLVRLWLDRLRLLGIAIGLIAGMWISLIVLSIGGLVLFLVVVLGYSILVWIRRRGRVEWLTDSYGHRTWRSWLHVLPALIPLVIVGCMLTVWSITSAIYLINTHQGLFGTWMILEFMNS